MFGVVPIFGLASAGVASVRRPWRCSPNRCRSPSSPACSSASSSAIFGAIWLAVRAGFAPRPEGTSWRQLYGAAMLCGIGFTMSLFIGALAFPGRSARDRRGQDRHARRIAAVGNRGLRHSSACPAGRAQRRRCRRSRRDFRGRPARLAPVLVQRRPLRGSVERFPGDRSSISAASRGSSPAAIR